MRPTALFALLGDKFYTKPCRAAAMRRSPNMAHPWEAMAHILQRSAKRMPRFFLKMSRGVDWHRKPLFRGLTMRADNKGPHLSETNSHPPAPAPRDVAGALHLFGPDDQREVVRDRSVAANLETRTGRRDVAHHAIDTAGWCKRNR